MPYKSEAVIIAGTQFDRRVKLSPDDKHEIQGLHNDGISIRELSRRFKVNRRLIQFIVYPERQVENIIRRNERGGSKQYYKREAHAKAIDKTRKYKQELFLDGKVSIPKE